jgi:hypothetical protein
MIIGFIYRIDYKGDNIVIKNCSYAGSKRITNKTNWDSYFGSPSTKNCIKCKTWKLESKKNPQDFHKQIIKYVDETENLIFEEIKFLRSVSDNIIKDLNWLNNSIPRLGAFPEFIFDQQTMSLREEKRIKTTLKNKGIKYAFLDKAKAKQTCLERYGVDHQNKRKESKDKNAQHKKVYFGSMTPEDKKLHGLKSKLGRDAQNVKNGILKTKQTKNQWSNEYKEYIENKRKIKWFKSVNNRSEADKKIIFEKYKFASKKLRKQYYITIEYMQTGDIKSLFLNDWLNLGFARDGIMSRIKKNLSLPLYSRTLNIWIKILKYEKIAPITMTF